MAFSIDNLLKKQNIVASKDSSSSSSSADSSDRGAIREASGTDMTLLGQTAGPTAYPWPPLEPSTDMGGGGPAPLASHQLPTLADLQMLFGGGGPKAHYRRNRRSGADRKPRQAYSSKQLEKLEDEFKKDKYLSVSKRVDLSKSLNLSETQIKTWFQNRRTKWKKQVTASLRQLYRHGLYSQYAAAAAAAVSTNPAAACFMPMLSPAGIYGQPMAAADQAGPSSFGAPWTMPGAAAVFMGMAHHHHPFDDAAAVGQSEPSSKVESTLAIGSRSNSAASSSCSSETSSIITE